MIKNKEAILKDVFKFILGLESIDGLYIEERIKRICTPEGSTAGKIYKIKDRKDNMSYFTKEQIEYVKSKTREHCIFFGFVKHETNPFGVVEFADLTADEIKNLNGIVQFNENNIKRRVAAKANGEIEKSIPFT